MYGTLGLLERAGLWDFCFGRGQQYPPLDPELDARLREQLRPDLEELERMIGRDLSAWKRGPGGARIATTGPQSAPIPEAIRRNRVTAGFQ